MKFSEILRELLFECNYSQTEFAHQINVKPSQVSEWLKGKANPGYETLRMIASALNIPADYLLGLEDDLGVRSAAPIDDELSSEERELLRLYRGLSPYLKGMTMEAVKTWAKKDENGLRKKG